MSEKNIKTEKYEEFLTKRLHGDLDKVINRREEYQQKLKD